EVPVGIRAQLAAAIHRRLLWILHGVKAIRRRVPDVELCAGNRHPGAVEPAPLYDEPRAFAVQRDVRAALDWHAPFRIEGPEQRRFSHSSRAAGADVVCGAL